MATTVAEDSKPTAVQEAKEKATGFIAGIHSRLDQAKTNAKQKYLDLLDLLASVTKEWITPDDKAGQRMSSFKVPPAVASFWESCKKYAADNPVMAMTILALVATCAVPVIFFLSFAAITLLVTFIGFLCVEGTLLGIASVFLGGVLLVVGFFTLTGVSFALVAYLILSKIYTYFTGDTEPQRYLAKLPVIGYLFANIDHSGANGDAVKIPNGADDASDESLAHTD